MLKTTIVYKLLIGICFFVLILHLKANAQIVIGTPSLGFTQACASESFNTYSATFIFSPEAQLDSSNEFIVEMSDANGDFAAATVVYTSAAGSVSTSPATLDFSIPETSAGEDYRIRIKSTSPAATSTASTMFAAYYKYQDAPFTINNLVSTGAFCTGGSYVLSIDNPGTGSNDSPLNYPTLTYNWFKETGPTTSVFVATGPTLTVTEEGTYFVETNYGTCTSNSFSNRVEISEATSGEANVTIASSLGNPFCPEQGSTTLTTIGGNSYQWYKDGDLIADATNQIYQTTESGEYSVQVDLGDCSASGTINLVSELFESDINVSEINTIEDGESLTVTVTTDANSPEFEWYLDDQMIVGATTNTYDASDFGTYKVVIYETIGCNGSKEIEFTINEAIDLFPDVDKIPNLISPNGDGVNDTWMLPLRYVNGTNTDVKILNDRGELVFRSINYENNWPVEQLNLTSVNALYYYIITTQDNKVKQGTITIIK